MEWRHTSLLLLLDLSATFNIVHQTILLRHLEVGEGIRRCTLDSFKSFLIGMMQRVAVGGQLPSVWNLSCGFHKAPSMLFNLYIKCLLRVLQAGPVRSPLKQCPQVYIARLGSINRCWQPGAGTRSKELEVAHRLAPSGLVDPAKQLNRLGRNQAQLSCLNVLYSSCCTVLWPGSYKELLFSLPSSGMGFRTASQAFHLLWVTSAQAFCHHCSAE